MRIRTLATLCAMLAVPGGSLLAQTAATDSAAVVATIEAYHAALASGDSLAALRLLASDAVILESGDVETRSEYHAHHLAADIAYSKAMPSARGAVMVRISGDVAWATSTSTTQGTYRERAVNSIGAELMVLSRSRSGWVIRAIHWSSRNVRSGS